MKSHRFDRRFEQRRPGRFSARSSKVSNGHWASNMRITGMMRQSTRKKVALVTGAGSATGIGFAIAKKLAQNGFAMVITSTTERIQERAEELRQQGATSLRSHLT